MLAIVSANKHDVNKNACAIHNALRYVHTSAVASLIKVRGTATRELIKRSFLRTSVLLSIAVWRQGAPQQRVVKLRDKAGP